MYRKSFYAFGADGKPSPAVVRRYRENDFDELIGIQSECFPPPFPSELWWNKEQLGNHVRLFPEGALCVEVDGTLAGSITGLLVDFNPSDPNHAWADVTDNGYIRTHRPDGDTLYIVDISVRPSFRKWGLGKHLMQSMYELVIERRLARLLGGGRMSGYHRVAEQMTAEQYLQKVAAGELKDPVITFLLRCGRTPLGVVEGYLDDEESRNYAALMEWRNPFMAR
ncbi:GNAT family N-acetyltransferase [Paenibacillus sp. MBLB4367]|uniref:GNAT family N-acetyltransferase n=1 Tax=Paenibacillus sp. MBLB4367 TaxID=3384767 RepID=UPI00390831C5